MSLPLQQSPEFARALSALGVPVVSVSPVIIERRLGPFGRVGFASRLSPENLACRPRLVNLETPDEELMRRNGYRQIITPAHIAEWDLTDSDRHKHMHGKWRNQLRKGWNAPLHVRETRWNGEEHWLFNQAEKMAKARKFRTYSTSLLATFAQVNPDSAWLFEATVNGEPSAACLVLRHGATATYQTAWSNGSGYRLNAPRVLLDRAAERLATWGHETFDLGLVETDHAPGLARFKLGTGAQVRPLGGTWLRFGRTRPLAPTHAIA